ncbi:MAG TPA: TonB-dependent receptor [Chitinophagaceae bacterium]
MKKTIALFALILIGTIQSDAQTVKGTVTDDDGQPLPDVSVTVKGTFLGTVTDRSGAYRLPLGNTGTYTLQIAHVGFQPIEQTVTATEATDYEVSANLQKAAGALKEITVTASRKAEIVDRTPAAVQVINAREVQTQLLISPNISNILAQAAPSIAFGTNTTSNVGQTLRGRTPLILVDGIPQSTPLRSGGRDIRTIDPASIERVEVVKGATAIYGNGADGGVINYITKKGAAAKAFNAYTYLANTGMLAHTKNTLGGRLTQQFNGTLNQFDYIVSGTYERTGVNKSADGVALSPTYGLGESNIYNGFAKLGYNINAKHRLEGMYNFFGSAQNSSYKEQTGTYDSAATIGVKGERPGEQEGTRYNHNTYLKYIGKDLFLGTDIEAGAYLQSFYTVFGYEPTYFENGGQSTIKSDKRGVRLNLNTPYRVAPWWKGDVVYGIDVMRDVTAQVLTDGRLWTPEMEMTNSAPYVQASATLFDDFILKAGYRYDDVQVDIPGFTQIKINSGGRLRGGNTVKADTVAFSASTFNAGLRWARYELFKPFVSYTQGFSIIDIGRFLRGPSVVSVGDIDPVTVNNYEAGFNSSHRLFDFAASYFISTNEVGASRAAENGIYVQQKAPEKTWGYELQLDLRLVDKLSFGGAYVWVEGKADKNKNDSFDDEVDTYLSGIKISAPKASAYVRYAPLKTVSLYAQWLHFGDRKRFAPHATTGLYGLGEGPVEGEGIVNLSTSWQATRNLQFSLGIENLLNKDYFGPAAQWQAKDGEYVKANGVRYQLGVGIKW